jgi:hypothetical protein
MSQMYGLCPTNHPIGQSAIRLILSIGHLGERQRHGRRNAELTPVSMALASNRCARLTLIPRSAFGWALPSPARSVGRIAWCGYKAREERSSIAYGLGDGNTATSHKTGSYP